MSKNKKIGLAVLLVIGILICTWSIYNSITTMSQNNNSTKQLTDNNSSNTNNGSPTIIDGEESNENTSKSTKKNSSDEDAFSNSLKESSEKYIIYTVEKDETLKDICEKYSDKCPIPVLSKAILQINNLSNSSKISEGNKLKIPEKYISTGIKYTVRNGDSLSSIAMRFMKDYDYSEALKIIKQDNFLSSDTIKVGDELFIRNYDSIEVSSQLENKDTKNKEDKNDKEDKASSKKSTEDSKDKDKDKDENKDKDNDKETMNQNVDKSKNNAALNSLTNRIGNLVTYTVKKNDTLNSIAKNYENTCPVQVASKIILQINNLDSSSSIKEGMKIKLPENYLSKGKIYKVKAGDTLSNIVAENMPNIDHDLALKIIVEDNDIKNHTIYPNQELFITSIEK